MLVVFAAVVDPDVVLVLLAVMAFHPCHSISKNKISFVFSFYFLGVYFIGENTFQAIAEAYCLEICFALMPIAHTSYLSILVQQRII